MDDLTPVAANQPTSGNGSSNQSSKTLDQIDQEEGGNANLTMAAGEPSLESKEDPTTTDRPAKKTLKERILHEVVEIGIVIVYLATSFCILQTFRCATLLASCSQNDFLTGYATAGVTALLLGKFVFVIEKMPISKRFNHAPLIVSVLYKTVLFTILINFFLHAEDRIMHRPPIIPQGQDIVTFWPCLFAHELAIFVVFFIFFVVREIARVLGEGKLRRMFFISQK